MVELHEAPFLSLAGVSKRYERVQALQNADITLYPGHCHALVGENGAGKSTLIKIIGGMVRPDAGSMTVEGRDVELSSPAEALKLGISVVPQELIFVPNLSVAENILLGDFTSKASFVDFRRTAGRARELLGRLGVDVDVTAPLGSLSPAVQQLAMIARGLAKDAKLLILDEPTAALSDQEAEHLFTVLDDLRESGMALVYVSHRMAELRRLAQDVTVLRDGERVASWMGEGVPDDERLIEAMVGRSITRFFSADRKRTPSQRERLRVTGLSRRGVLNDVSFSVAEGEILAITGLMGAGRTEVLRCLVGADQANAMEVAVDGEVVGIRNPAQAKQAGIALVPEERKTQGLVGGMTVTDNISLPHLKRWSKVALLLDRKRRPAVAQVATQVGLRPTTYDTPVQALSGGNQQKAVIGKAVLGNPRIILLDEPTRGIDVAVKHEIYALIGRLADEGCAVVVVSSDMLEVLGIADRILVLRAGEVVGCIDGDGATESDILRLSMPDLSSHKAAGVGASSTKGTE
ncbi:sugar ABC transporter ATP-binding protein [Planosporangium flavigriseum]|uniref:Sugar ABC transporter ATP-binding protein n=1 Tax=Planosporangium flavigriseum TaxID=373681 RepID=A0A8J3LQ73_9ACTN|nr:sugar ABC transporter ATP-binding protein [Planosporangium flavigriseum]NJC65502.1 sugar ABC transporter ATP-binding protein [Planosporangium flavigriseum]GIG76812.1 sugar ABC transporter ATP-binding protein [Planosporangium flavigriseum]